MTFPIREEENLDHSYTSFRDHYKPLPHPVSGKADHCSILLKKLKYISRVINKWHKVAGAWSYRTALRHRNYTDSVIGYVSKCIDDVVPKATCSYPNQKPWVS